MILSFEEADGGFRFCRIRRGNSGEEEATNTAYRV
jgi:hypothetical protein